MSAPSRTCESIIVPAVDSGSVPYQFANLHIALVRDCLLDNLWFDLSSQLAVSPTHWQFIREPKTGQLSISGLSQRVNLKRGLLVFMPPAVLHPWQAAPPLPSLIEIDSSITTLSICQVHIDGAFLNAMLEYSFPTLGIV